MAPDGDAHSKKRGGSRSVQATPGAGDLAVEARVDPTSVFIRGLPEGLSDGDIRRWLESRSGPTVTCYRIRGDYGLVKFKQEADAQRCLDEVQGAEFEGSALTLEIAKPKRQRLERRAAPAPGTMQPIAAASGSASSTAVPRGSSTQGVGAPLDLRSVQLNGVPRDVKKKALEAWIEQQLPGGCGIDEVRRALGEDSDATSTTDKLGTFFVTFRKEANARRAMEVLEGAQLNGHKVSCSFRALARNQQSAKAGRLIVRNLAFGATAKHVRKAFEKIGALVDVHLPMKGNAGPGDGQHRGFGFVQYVETADAARAIAELNGTKICGRGVAVDMSVDATLYSSLQREEQQQKRPRQEEPSNHKAGAVDDEDGDGKGESDEDEDEEEEEEEEDGVQERSSKDTRAEVSRMRSLLGDRKDAPKKEEEEKESDEDDDDEQGKGGESGGKADKKNAETSALPPRKSGYDLEQGRTVFVRNVPFDATEEDLRDTFRKFGQVGSVKFVADKSGENAHRGSAFVKFRTADGATAALATEEEAERKVKELAGVIRKSDQRDLPAMEGFGISLKGRRLVLKSAMTPEQITVIASEKKPEKGAALKERAKWMHLVHVGEIDEKSDQWEGLTKSEKRQRQESIKERKWRVGNPNFAIHPLRLSVRNLPPNVDVTKLRETVATYLSELPGIGGDGANKKARTKAAQAAIVKASLVRDSERRNANNERRSRGFGFIALKDHHYAMKTLEFLNDNSKAFGGGRRPIVEFAIEDKRKLRMQEELYQKHAHKLLAKASGKDSGGDPKAEGKGKGKGSEKVDGSEAAAKSLKQKKKKKNKDGPPIMSRGQRQRENRRQKKAEAEVRNKTRALADDIRAKDRAKGKTKRDQEREAERPKKGPGKRHQPDAGFESSKAAKRARPSWEMSDDFELRAMERFRQAGR